MIVFLTIRRSQTFDEVVRSQLFATFNATKAVGMPYSVEYKIAILWNIINEK
jgi:hypothetical protein